MQPDLEEVSQVLLDVFGQSDTESDAAPEVLCGHAWKKIDEIHGLWLCKGCITAEQQEEMVSAIDAEGWFMDSTHNQAMRFKDLPWWALQLSKLIYDAISSYILANDSSCFSPSSQISTSDLPFSLDLLWRVPLFDQMIVNRYLPGEGICAHVDLLQFEDGIAILSLESTCVMHFTHCLPRASMSEHECQHKQQAGHTYATEEEHGFERKDKVPVLLEPGDLVLLSGEARYNWTHEINRSDHCQVWKGKRISQMRRTSVTLRKLVMPKEGCR
eukprot:c18479_g1_i1 orf=553-1368(-)